MGFIYFLICVILLVVLTNLDIIACLTLQRKYKGSYNFKERLNTVLGCSFKNKFDLAEFDLRNIFEEKIIWRELIDLSEGQD